VGGLDGSESRHPLPSIPTEKPTKESESSRARGRSHHYTTDERGVLTKVNLIVGTTNNYAPISMSINKAASSFIKHGVIVSEGILNRVEMAFRAYDPCFGCATHSLPGTMPLQITIRSADGQTMDVLKQYC
jgi:F420-non-reducing hydrogenase large subunit